MHGATVKKGRLQELAGEFYEAVLTPTRWPEVVKLTCTIFDVPYALVYSPFAARIGLDPLWIHNADPELIETYVAKYAHDDLVAQAQWRLMPADRLTATYRELIGDDVWEAWGFYQELCKPRGVWNGITVAVQATDYRATNLTLFTPPWSAGREARAKAALCWLADHFDRAVRLHWKVSAGQRQDVAARISLDLLDVGVVW
ncbi:MAG: hypothetical protein QOK29_4752, partial [Rhodospirillaceae bacterium]|nr:hypothetical protein [Rhodospirillaceae bacterium]